MKNAERGLLALPHPATVHMNGGSRIGCPQSSQLALLRESLGSKAAPQGRSMEGQGGGAWPPGAWGGEAQKVNSEKPASLALFKALPLSLALSL